MNDVLSRIMELPMGEKTQLLTDAAIEIGQLRDRIRSMTNMVEEARREARAAIGAATPIEKRITPRREV